MYVRLSRRVLARSLCSSVLATVLVVAPEAQRLGRSRNLSVVDPPRVTTTLQEEPAVFPGDVVRFTVRVEDPNAGLVSLRLGAAPPGVVLAPAIDQPVPFEREVLWVVPEHVGGLRRIELVATDETLQRGRATVMLQVVGAVERTSVVTGDVTGDGIADVVGVASAADTGGLGNSGGVYVWSGAELPDGDGTPSASLLAEDAHQNDYLGQAGNQSPGAQAIQLADVTGDGVLDVVAVATLADIGGVRDVGAIYVWEGGTEMAGDVPSSSRLRLFGARSFDLLGESAGQGVLLVDVTGDGIRDVVAGAALADGAGINRGAIHVWRGGASLLGQIGPNATLAVPTAADFETLGGSTEQGIRAVDVSGDGVLDLVVPAPLADAGGGVANGAVYVWHGGATLSGSVAPDAVLTDVTATGIGALVLDFADVTGDGILDVVTAATDRALVFAGGPGLAGTTAPAAILAPILGTPGLASGRGLRLADVTADGLADVVLCAQDAALAGLPDIGAIYVWHGGVALGGTVAADAYLIVPTATAGDALGRVDSSLGQGLQLVDVTGDGLLDVLAAASRADVDGVADAGELYVWPGGPGGTLRGLRAPLARLNAPAPVAGDALGAGEGGQRILLGDVDADGRADVVVGAPRADRGIQVDAGAVYVWRGGPALAGSPEPRATLTASAPAFLDRLTEAAGQGLHLADLTGDGVLDVVVAAAAGEGGQGTVLVFAGGTTLGATGTPTAELLASDGEPGDRMGDLSGEALVLRDRTRDGILDVVTGSRNAPGGVVYVFAGAAGLAGVTEEHLALRATASDRLGDAGGQGLQVADVTGDGRPDLIVGAQFADIQGILDTGAIYVWDEPDEAAAGAALWVPTAAGNDRLTR